MFGHLFIGLHFENPTRKHFRRHFPKVSLIHTRASDAPDATCRAAESATVCPGLMTGSTCCFMVTAGAVPLPFGPQRTFYHRFSVSPHSVHCPSWFSFPTFLFFTTSNCWVGAFPPLSPNHLSPSFCFFRGSLP